MQFLDTLAHLHAAAANFPQQYETSEAPRFGRRYVHIGEAHRGYLGSGSVDHEGLFRALVTSGYAGPITFESFSSAVVSKDLSNALCVWRNLWEDGDDLAVHARQFIDSQLRAASQGQHYQ